MKEARRGSPDGCALKQRAGRAPSLPRLRGREVLQNARLKRLTSHGSRISQGADCCVRTRGQFKVQPDAPQTLVMVTQKASHPTGNVASTPDIHPSKRRSNSRQTQDAQTRPTGGKRLLTQALKIVVSSLRISPATGRTCDRKTERKKGGGQEKHPSGGDAATAKQGGGFILGLWRDSGFLGVFLIGRTRKRKKKKKEEEKANG